ncbi:MAG: ABC-2 transporter permease, partial [Defluviitaleaceae bacterium]|nr:ABC-2 transporter permease [Defluviitaleaceae bacterium]
RYLFALIIGLAYVLVGAVLGFVMWKIMGDGAGMTPLIYWATLAVAFTYFGFAMGIAYPIYFKFTFAKAYVFTMIPMYVIVVLFLVLTKKDNNLAASLGSIVRFFTAHVYLAPIFGLLAGLILLTVSALIANLVYTRKEI